MKVLVAPDSFKGSLTSSQVCGHIKNGILRIYPDAHVEAVPVADGGEGTVECIVDAAGGHYRTVEVRGPLGEKVDARYGIIGEETAIIEMAQSSGLTLVPPLKRNPLVTSSYGFGEQIKDALDLGCKRIVLGIGGSATNDCGVGMAEALGVRFLDKDGLEVEACGGSLGRIADIDMNGIDPRIKYTEFTVVSDVTNPLCGERGASRVYGPQKGATPEMVELLDRNLAHIASVIKDGLGVDMANLPGAGAAGGVGGGLIAFCGARLVMGIDYILDITGINSKIESSDIVITGEGRIDGQTAFGKVPVGISKRAKKYNKPVFAICGSIGDDFQLVYEHGIDAVVSSISSPCTIDEAMGDAANRLEEAAERLFRIIRASSGL